MEEMFEHEYCYICKQCDNGYESREELEDHRNIKHIENFYSSEDESAGNGSCDDKLRIESEEELEEINTIEKQKVKEFELLDLNYGRTRLEERRNRQLQRKEKQTTSEKGETDNFRER